MPTSVTHLCAQCLISHVCGYRILGFCCSENEGAQGERGELMQPPGKPDVQRIYGSRFTRRFQAAPIAFWAQTQNIASQRPKIPCISPTCLLNLRLGVHCRLRAQLEALGLPPPPLSMETSPWLRCCPWRMDLALGKAFLVWSHGDTSPKGLLTLQTPPQHLLPLQQLLDCSLLAPCAPHKVCSSCSTGSSTKMSSLHHRVLLDLGSCLHSQLNI